MQRKIINDLEYIEIRNQAATARIALQGAHIFHYQRANEAPLLWLSDVSDFEIGKAIRGGVPICWPSFGNNNPQLAQHGFARVMMWQLVNADESNPYISELTFVLEDSQQSRALWNYKFRVEFIVKVGLVLEMELKTVNLDTAPFTLTQALHTYFAVSSIENISIKGLEEKKYLDALTLQEHFQEGSITFDQELDRVYQGVENSIVLEDLNRSVNIQNSGSKSVVVWNPWIEKCARMSAMQAESYKEFVCIESANAYEDKRIIQPNQEHILKTILS
ncbi:D-hexose-6-phosphate mutarotase [Sulfurimonas sp. C5]|uniref:D-hexose-6-phosphate mutarotase n=1 Tax=Sulfurimonas sp. C5 TaxID=3036947 RepID=UPI0024557279|nr:D-hexose-6-phosphate mutarotase [Sulfurimonas sp. C5]MDH4944350.1 D-hexose-6-phosphate mutarotase [Sulfurimonas sp. C5]